MSKRPASPEGRSGRSNGLELIWPGKYEADGQRSVTPDAGAALVLREEYAPSRVAEVPGAAEVELVFGDNLAGLQALVRSRRGEARLVYIDPPFGTGNRFGVGSRLGDGPELQLPAYSDSWDDGIAGLIAMLEPRVSLLRELLSDDGSLYVHVDPTVAAPLKLLLDEVFGAACFQREIVWRIGWVSGYKTRARNWIRNHDVILYYVKDPARFVFNKQYVAYPEGYRRRDGALPKGQGVPLDDVWNAHPAEQALRGGESLDSIQIKSFSTEKTGYATQKNESLLRRIIMASSEPGDLVVDAFSGSGTTVVAASQCGRRGLGIDCAPSAIHLSRKRLLAAGVAVKVHEVRLREERQVAATAGAIAWAPAWLEEQGYEPERGPGSQGLEWWGFRGARASVVCGETIDSAAVARVRSHARARGCKDVELLASRYELPWPWPPSSAKQKQPDLPRVVCSRFVPLSLAPQGPDDVLIAEIPEVSLALLGLEQGRVHVELRGLAYAGPVRHEQLAKRCVTPLELVDQWAVAMDAEGEVLRPSFVSARDRQTPMVEPRSPGWTLHAEAFAQTPVRVRVQIVDVFHMQLEIAFTLASEDGGVRVIDARLQA